MENKTALLLGASGLVGGHCLKFLLDDSYYGIVKTLVRRPLGIKHAKLEEHLIDFERMETYAHLLDADDVFCCLGTTIGQANSREAFYKVDFTYPQIIAKEAVSRGAKQFLIISAMGAYYKSPIFYSRVKGEIEDAVRALPYRAVHIFRPSLILGNRKESRPAEAMAGKVLKYALPFMIGPLSKYRPIEAKAIGFAMVQVAKEQLSGGIYESDRIQEISSRQKTS